MVKTLTPASLSLLRVTSICCRVVVINAERPTASTCFLLRDFEDFRGRDILAQVNHLEAVVLQQGTNDILADVVNITFNCSHQDTSQRGAALAGKILFKVAKCCLHGFSGAHNLGEKNTIVGKTTSHLFEARQQALVTDRHSVQPLLHGVLDQGNDPFAVASDDRRGKTLTHIRGDAPPALQGLPAS